MTPFMLPFDVWVRPRRYIRPPLSQTKCRFLFVLEKDTVLFPSV